eukprot:53051_1
MMVNHRLQLTFWSKNNKVDQVLKKSMDIFTWFTMENELRFDEQKCLTHLQLCFFRSPQSPTDYSQNFGTKKYFAVYATKQYSMIPGLLEIYSVVLLLLWKVIGNI